MTADNSANNTGVMFTVGPSAPEPLGGASVAAPVVATSELVPVCRVDVMLPEVAAFWKDVATLREGFISTMSPAEAEVMMWPSMV